MKALAPPTASSRHRDGTVLWEVVEEHYERLGSLVAALHRAHAHPLMTLTDVARGIERRLLIELDALLIAGPEVVGELPERMADPVRADAAALALVANGLDEAAASLFGHEDRSHRLEAVRGAGWAASERFDGVASRCVAQSKTPGEKGAWLELLGLRALQPRDAAALLASTDSEVVFGALRCLRGSVPSLVHSVERLVEHQEPLVRERALRVALAWGSQHAWEQCEARALDTQEVSVPAMTALALLGGAAQRERLVTSASMKGRALPVLRALGFSGSPEVVPLLLERLGAKDVVEAKVAAQALVAVTGVDLRRDEVAAPASPEKADPLPPLEADDLDANLIPAPEEVLPIPNARALRRWWTSEEEKLTSQGARRLVLGQPRSSATFLDALEDGPLGLREGWAMALHLWSGGRLWLDVEAFSGPQRAQLAAARSAGARWPSNRLVSE